MPNKNLEEENILYTENAYNKLSMDKYINIKFNTKSFDEVYGKTFLEKYDALLGLLIKQKNALTPETEEYNETVALIDDLVGSTNAHELNPDGIESGTAPKVRPTKITDRDTFLDLVVLKSYSESLNFLLKTFNKRSETPRRIFANPGEIEKICLDDYSARIDSLPEDDSVKTMDERTRLLKNFALLKSYITLYSKVSTQEARDAYDEELYGPSLKKLALRAEFAVLTKNEFMSQKILADYLREGREVPKELLVEVGLLEEGEKLPEELVELQSQVKVKETEIVPELNKQSGEVEPATLDGQEAKLEQADEGPIQRVTGSISEAPKVHVEHTKKGSFYYDQEKSGFVVDRNDTHTKLKNMFEFSNIGDIDDPNSLVFTRGVGTPARSILNADRRTREFHEKLAEASSEDQKAFKDYVDLPYRWLFAKYENPIDVFDEYDANGNRVSVQHAGTLFTEGLIQRPTYENVDGNATIRNVKSQAYTVTKTMPDGHSTQDIVFFNSENTVRNNYKNLTEFMRQHSDFFKNVIFSDKFMKLIKEKNASYAGDVIYDESQAPGAQYKINVNDPLDYLRVGSLQLAMLTQESALQSPELAGMDEGYIRELLKKYTQGPLVIVHGMSNYDSKGPKRLPSILAKLKKKPIEITRFTEEDLEEPKTGLKRKVDQKTKEDDELY